MLLDVLLPIGLLIVVAKLAEGVLGRFGLNAIVAYALTGVLLGPVIGIVEPTDELHLFLDIGIFVLFFIIGLDEIDVPGFVATIRGRYFVAAIISVGVSLLVALSVTSDFLDADFVLGLEFEAALALAGVLSLSSLGLVAKVLADGGHLKEPIGLKMFAVVIIAEVFALLVVGFTIGDAGHGGDGHTMSATAVVLLLGQIVGFVVVAWVLSTRLLPAAIEFLQRFLNVPELSFGLMIGCLFLVVVAAEEFGLHGTIGALLFGAGLSGVNQQVRLDILPGMRSASEGLFVPLFFASAGLHFDLSFTELPASMIAALVLVPLAGKFFGAFIGTFVTRIDTPVALATGLMAKGVAEIALLLILFNAETIDGSVFSLLLLVMIGYILLMPQMIQLAVRRARVSDPAYLPKNVPPSFARYALESIKVSNVVDTTRTYPGPETSVRDFMDQWTVPNQHDYVVLDDGEMAGIVSVGRLRFVPKRSRPTRLLAKVLRRTRQEAYPEEAIDDVLKRMVNRSLTVMPVKEPDSGRFLGTVTSDDILGFVVLMKEIQDELRMLGEPED